jgi:hypothetical protein
MAIPESLNIDQFSKYMKSIRVLYMSDEDFRNLCDDYNMSKVNIEMYKGKLQEDIQRRLEFENLSQDLEKEILRYLSKMK